MDAKTRHLPQIPDVIKEELYMTAGRNESASGKPPLVLAVDDEAKILELLVSYLQSNGCRTLLAATASKALDLFRSNPVDLVLLDLMLPDSTGEELCHQVRAVSDVPVIMISARTDEDSVIRGLNIGADDYVCKPFSPRQLMARVRAALRRAGSEADGKAGGRTRFVRGGLLVDTEARTISREGATLPLTACEYKILALLLSRPSKIFTRDEIIEHAKGDDVDGFDRAIDTQIKRLRQKIGDDPKAPAYIGTVYGMGYRFAGGDKP
jgi:DNA-binding response OmpR family regulator